MPRATLRLALSLSAVTLLDGCATPFLALDPLQKGTFGGLEDRSDWNAARELKDRGFVEEQSRSQPGGRRGFRVLWTPRNPALGDIAQLELDDNVITVLPRWTPEQSTREAQLAHLGLKAGKPLGLCTPHGLLRATDRPDVQLLERIRVPLGSPGPIIGYVLAKPAEYAERGCELLFDDVPGRVESLMTIRGALSARTLLDATRPWRPELVARHEMAVRDAIPQELESLVRDYRLHAESGTLDEKLEILFEVVRLAQDYGESPSVRGLADEIVASHRATLDDRARAYGSAQLLAAAEKVSKLVAEGILPKLRAGEVVSLDVREVAGPIRAAQAEFNQQESLEQARAEWPEGDLLSQIEQYGRLVQSHPTSGPNGRARIETIFREKYPQLIDRLKKSAREAENAGMLATAAGYRLVLAKLTTEPGTKSNQSTAELETARAIVSRLWGQIAPRVDNQPRLAAALASRRAQDRRGEWGASRHLGASLSASQEQRGPVATLDIGPVAAEPQATTRTEDAVYWFKRTERSLVEAPDPGVQMQANAARATAAEQLAFMKANRGPTGGGCRVIEDKNCGYRFSRQLATGDDRRKGYTWDYKDVSSYTTCAPSKEVCSFSDAEIAEAERELARLSERSGSLQQQALDSTQPRLVDDSTTYKLHRQSWSGTARRKNTLTIGDRSIVLEQTLDLSRYEFARNAADPAHSILERDEWKTAEAVVELARAQLDTDLVQPLMDRYAELAVQLGQGLPPEELAWRRFMFGRPDLANLPPSIRTLTPLRPPPPPQARPTQGSDAGAVHKVSSYVDDLRLSADGQRLVTVGSSFDDSARFAVYDVLTGETLARDVSKGDPRMKVAFVPERHAFVLNDRWSIEVRDLSTGLMWVRHQLPCEAENNALSANGKRVLIFCRPYGSPATIHLIDVDDGSEIRRHTPRHAYDTFALNADGSRYAIDLSTEQATQSRYTVFESATGKVLLETAPMAQFSTLSPDGRWVLEMHEDKSTKDGHVLRLWSVDEAKVVHTFNDGELPTLARKDQTHWGSDGRRLYFDGYANRPLRWLSLPLPGTPFSSGEPLRSLSGQRQLPTRANGREALLAEVERRPALRVPPMAVDEYDFDAGSDLRSFAGYESGGGGVTFWREQRPADAVDARLIVVPARRVRVDALGEDWESDVGSESGLRPGMRVRQFEERRLSFPVQTVSHGKSTFRISKDRSKVVQSDPKTWFSNLKRRNEELFVVEGPELLER
jgi:hypothetical protein